MKNFFKVCLVGACLVAGNAYADLTQRGTVTRVTVTGSSVYVQLSSATINPARCSSTAVYSYQSDNKTTFNRVYAAILSAQASSIPMVVNISPTECNGNYPQITSLTSYD